MKVWTSILVAGAIFALAAPSYAASARIPTDPSSTQASRHLAIPSQPSSTDVAIGKLNKKINALIAKNKALAAKNQKLAAKVKELRNKIVVPVPLTPPGGGGIVVPLGRLLRLHERLHERAALPPPGAPTATSFLLRLRRRPTSPRSCRPLRRRRSSTPPTLPRKPSPASRRAPTARRELVGVLTDSSTTSCRRSSLPPRAPAGLHDTTTGTSRTHLHSCPPSVSELPPDPAGARPLPALCRRAWQGVLSRVGVFFPQRSQSGGRDDKRSLPT